MSDSWTLTHQHDQQQQQPQQHKRLALLPPSPSPPSPLFPSSQLKAVGCSPTPPRSPLLSPLPVAATSGMTADTKVLKDQDASAADQLSADLTPEEVSESF